MAYTPVRELLGGFISFIEAGTTVGGTTLSETAAPASTDAAWDDCSLGCIQNFVPESADEDDSYKCPNRSGGWTEVESKVITKNLIKLTLNDHTEPVYRMLFGLQSEIVNGVAQQPFANSTPEIYGWIRVQSVARDGTQRVEGLIWGKLTLTSYPGWTSESIQPEVTFQVLDSTLNEMTFQLAS